MSTTTSREIGFASGTDRCVATLVEAVDDRLVGERGRPAVVLAHGLAGTVDSGLLPFAETFAAAGIDALAFDYRGFGLSGGGPRQTVSVGRQVEDYVAAFDTASGLPGVDPDRVAAWGVSLSGGHVLELAVRRAVAAAVALTPLVGGPSAGRLAARHHRPVDLARTTALAVRSRVGQAAMIPVVAAPGETGALTLSGAREDYLSIAGPSWRNEVDAAVALEIGAYRPGRLADQVGCPLLVQIADLDRSAPPHAAAKVAFNARAQVRHYPADHFDVWPGKPWFDAASAHAASFLVRALAP